MAKKKIAKKSAKKVVKSPKKASKKAPSKKKVAASVAPVVAPVQAAVDATADTAKDVMELPPAPVETKPADPAPAASTSAPVEKHEDFTSALTEEPPKKGFWARLFGK